MLPACLSTPPYFPSILRLFALLSLSCFCFYLGTRWATPYEDALFLPAQPSPSGYASLVLHRHPRDQDPGADDLDVHQALVDFRHAGASSRRSRSPGNDGSPPYSGVLRDDGSINHEFTGDEVTGDENLDIDWEDPDNNTIAYVSTKMSSSFKSYKFGVCPPTMKEYIPCLDNVAAIKQLKSTSKGEKFERHCPMEKGARFCCLIAPPPGYKYPIRWPQSRDKVWYNNVPHVRLVEDKGGQNWIAIKNDKFVFPGGGTQFAHGANQYLDQMAKMVLDIAFGVHTRVALDIGCGVASWGAYLMSRDVLPLSIAPKDVHENQIQFALERGVPAMVAALATRRLLYPSHAFDLIHCSRCRIEWNRDGGILLLEVDRILRSGGFFAWAAQPVYKHEGGLPEAWHDMEDLATRMCWKLVAKEGYIAIWQKPFDNTCYYNRTVGTQPPLCEASDDPDAVWYVPLKACITLLPESSMGSKVPDWPARLYSPPSRLHGVNTDANTAKKEVFIAEQRYWNEIVGGYLRGLGLKKEEVRNVMDMNAGYGGFAAALIDLKVDWWVLNVVPTTSIKTLPVIYDRGLIGVAHDWCESFDTYPRTYDLIHAVRLFTLEENRCNIARIVLEMDRILRPGGWVLVRESSEMVLKIESIARSVKWKTRILATESGPFGKDKLLSCQKELWHA